MWTVGGVWREVWFEQGAWREVWSGGRFLFCEDSVMDQWT